MKGSTLDKICAFLGELIGTGILVFLGCMGCVNSPIFANTHLQTILNFGFAVLIAIQCVGCVSGAHINPAVTVAALIYDMVTVKMALVYLVAQLLGAFIGYGLLKLLVPTNVVDVGHGLCVTLPHSEISVAQAFGIEFVVTSILILVCCGVWDPRNSNFHDSVGIRFGLAVAGLACAAVSSSIHLVLLLIKKNKSLFIFSGSFHRRQHEPGQVLCPRPLERSL